MRTLFLAFTVLFAAGLQCSAQGQMIADIVNQGPPPATYTGPGDIVASATAWYGLRAYSAAVAATGASQHVVDLRRASDNATCTANLDASSTGTLDLTVGTPCSGSTVTAWTNNASSCTGAIASTTLTVSSCTAGNLAVGLLIADANITAGTVITALGTGSGGAGTYTVSPSQTAASAVFTSPAWAYVSKAYDQSGGNACSAAPCNATQATAADQPLLLLNCNGSLPCISAATTQWLGTAVTPPTVSSPGSMSGVAYGRGGYLAGAGNTFLAIQFSSTQVSAGRAPNISVNVTNNVLHALNLAGSTTTSAELFNVDGATTTGTGTFTSSNTYGWMSGTGSVFSTLLGITMEAGFWGGTLFTSGNLSSLCHNQFV